MISDVFILTGPESTGKTTLATQLAEHFKINLVEEYARIYLNAKKDGKYDFADLKKIAEGQNELEQKVFDTISHQPSNLSKPSFTKKTFYICDTDLITINIWSEEVYQLSAISFQLSADSLLIPKSKRHYLLCSPQDVQWEFDPLRENPNDRDRLFKIYKKTLEDYKMNFIVLEGNLAERFYKAEKFILENLM